MEETQPFFSGVDGAPPAARPVGSGVSVSNPSGGAPVEGSDGSDGSVACAPSGLGRSAWVVGVMLLVFAGRMGDWTDAATLDAATPNKESVHRHSTRIGALFWARRSKWN